LKEGKKRSRWKRRGEGERSEAKEGRKVHSWIGPFCLSKPEGEREKRESIK